MGLFFCSIGATSTASGMSLGVMAPLAAFVGIMLLVHWAVMLLAARSLRLEPSTLLVASNALVGGPATAAGVFAASLPEPGFAACMTVGFSHLPGVNSRCPHPASP